MNMDTILRGLGGLLGAQVLLAAITWWPSGDGEVEARDLVRTAAADLSKIVVHPRPGSADADPLVLQQEDGDWVIASMFDYPASQTQLTTLFETIDKLEVRSPISTHDYNHAEMDVAADTFSRKLELTDGSGDTVTVYVGSAQGRSAHVRVDGDDNVFRVRGISSAIPEQATRYFERDFQKVDVDSVRSLTINRPDEAPVTFERVDADWTLPGLTPDGKVVDQSKARSFVQSTLNLRMLNPEGTAVRPDMGLETGVRVTWTEEQEGGASVTGEYAVGAQAGEEASHVYLKSSTSPYVFVGLTGQLQHAREKSIEDLFVDPVAEPPPGDPGGMPEGLPEGLEEALRQAMPGGAP